MKKHILTLLALPFAAFLVCTLPSCEKRQGPAEEIGEAIDDATDSRPAEGVKDAVEDATDTVKDAVN